MESIAIIAPHFHEYSLRLGNALALRAKVVLFIEKKRLDGEYAARRMPVSQNLVIVNVDFSSILDFVRVAACICRKRIRLVHIQEPVGFRRSVICACLVAVFSPFTSIILTVHDPIPHPGQDAQIGSRTSFLRSFIRHWARTVVVHGDYCLKQYQQFRTSANQKVLVSNHGAILDDPLDSEPKNVPSKNDFPREKVLEVLMFGRMEEYKGLDILCSAAEHLCKREVPVRFRILGTGPELNRLEKRIASISSVSVNNSYVAAVDLIRAVRGAGCIVMPYLSATQSGVLAAALANGKAIIASAVGGLPDIIKDGRNGILVPPGDPLALADALELISRDPVLRHRLEVAAKNTALNDLDWNRIVVQLWPNAYSIFNHRNV